VMIMTVWGFLYFDFSPFAVSLDSSLNCEKWYKNLSWI
jgi:hypothetical protein